MRRSALAPLAILALAGCNQYEMFRLAGYEQASFSNDADIVFIVDNSPSMEAEATALAENFGVFIDQLTTEGALPEGSVSNAVDAYVLYTSQRGQFLDYNLAITTTSVKDPGDSPPGVAGALVGDDYTVVDDSFEDVGGSFQANLLCESTCWNENDLNPEPNFDCPEDGSYPPTPDQISLQYLDCLCGGTQAWPGHCGAGTEEPIEAAFLSMCRSVEDPPDECFSVESPLVEADVLTNDFLREGSTVLFVIVTDEGDGSRRMQTGDEDPTVYQDLLDQFGVPYRFAVIGPNPDICQGGAFDGVERLQVLAEETGGFYNVIAEPGAGSDCQVSDFASHLEDLGDLLNNLLSSFPLQSVPDVSTLIVYVDGVEIPIAQESDYPPEGSESPEPTCDCWSYDASENSVRFHGTAIPDYGDDVEIFYKPLEGMPRTLPF